MNGHAQESPESVLQRLRELYPRRLESLAVIEEVCRLQHKHGSRDFSLKTVGRLSQERNGPGTRAIVNPNGAPYRQLIAAHAAARAPVRPRATAEDDLVKGVTSPLQRSRIKAALADARRWREEVRVWRRKANQLQAIANASTLITLDAGAGVADMPTARLGRGVSLDLLPLELEALTGALDGRRLQALGLQIDTRGRMLDGQGRALFPIGFATALAKVAAALGDVGR